MRVNFGLYSERGACYTVFPGALEKIYRKEVIKKWSGIFLSACLLLVCSTPLFNNFIYSLPIFIDKANEFLCLIGCYSGIAGILFFTWRETPRIILIYGCIMTEEFDSYIKKAISALENVMEIQSACATLNKIEEQAAKIDAAIYTGQTLLILSKELKDAPQTMADNIALIKACLPLDGFFTKIMRKKDAV